MIRYIFIIAIILIEPLSFSVSSTYLCYNNEEIKPSESIGCINDSKYIKKGTIISCATSDGIYWIDVKTNAIIFKEIFNKVVLYHKYSDDEKFVFLCFENDKDIYFIYDIDTKKIFSTIHAGIKWYNGNVGCYDNILGFYLTGSSIPISSSMAHPNSIVFLNDAHLLLLIRSDDKIVLYDSLTGIELHNISLSDEVPVSIGYNKERGIIWIGGDKGSVYYFNSVTFEQIKKFSLKPSSVEVNDSYIYQNIRENPILVTTDGKYAVTTYSIYYDGGSMQTICYRYVLFDLEKEKMLQILDEFSASTTSWLNFPLMPSRFFYNQEKEYISFIKSGAYQFYPIVYNIKEDKFYNFPQTENTEYNDFEAHLFVDSLSTELFLYWINGNVLSSSFENAKNYTVVQINQLPFIDISFKTENPNTLYLFSDANFPFECLFELNLLNRDLQPILNRDKVKDSTIKLPQDLSDDSSRVLSGGGDGLVEETIIKTGVSNIIASCSDPISFVKYLDEEKKVLAVNQVGKVYVFDRITGENVYQTPVKYPVFSKNDVAITKDEKYLIVENQVLNLQTREWVNVFGNYANGNTHIAQVRISPTEEWVAVRTEDCTVRVWDANWVFPQSKIEDFKNY